MEEKQERSFSGLHTLVALTLLFMAAITDTINQLFFAALFFIYLAFFHFIKKKGSWKLITFYFILGIIIGLISHSYNI
ncbi:hypothetical protein [Radiobacillus sp. PE A8.2]|uniref:hypothetical protein n=1 Tax=Radiobacillus sp. PE A8.2 TaxID=3380349 RepID=UPI00388EB081